MCNEAHSSDLRTGALIRAQHFESPQTIALRANAAGYDHVRSVTNGCATKAIRVSE